MITFGADPDKDVGWGEDAPTTNRSYYRRPISDLLNRFLYHKNMRMTQRVEDEHKAILASYFASKLRNGVTLGTLHEIIDTFWGHPASTGQFPALMFVKKDVQEKLLEEVDTQSDDPIVQWLLDGMPTSSTVDQEWRKALMHCTESLLRYPEVVLALLKRDAEVACLYELESIIDWNLHGDAPDPDAHYLPMRVGLPPELATSRRSPSRISPAHSSIASALLRTRRRK